MPNTIDVEALAAEFSEEGFVRIPQAFSAGQACAMQDVIWGELERAHGIRRDAPETWTIERPVQLQAIKADPAFEALAAEPVLATIDHLLGAGNWKVPKQWGGFHLAFPQESDDKSTPEGVTAPQGAWHADFHYTYDPKPVFGLVVFCFLDDVESHGGGTIALRASHKLVENFVSHLPDVDRKNYAQTRKKLAATDTWLRELMDGGDRRNEQFASAEFCVGQNRIIDGIELELVEFTAKAGDVILMHPWLLHTAAANHASRPRMMRAKAIYREESANG